MTPEQYERLTELFHAALEFAPNERPAFLDQVWNEDASLGQELKSLLAAQQRAAPTEFPEDIAAAYLAQVDPGASLLAPNTRIDRYEIRSLLGKGGMGEVYLAEDLRLHRKVALKILPAAVAADQDRMRRFEQEASTAAALNHAHIAHIYEIGESESTRFIALEYIEGDTLRDKIHRDQSPLPELLKYLIQVAEGLAKAHTAGVVHRDLKPDNIMITRDDYAKILDFGLAKLIEPRTSEPDCNSPGRADAAVESRHSMAGIVMGTAGYMSPEQAQGKVEQLDQRSDIFSFGCILFEAVTRQKPFADESIIKSLHKVVHEPAPLISAFNPEALPELQRVISSCLAKDRDQRYQTIKEVAIDLNEVRRTISAAMVIETTFPLLERAGTSNRQTDRPTVKSMSSAEYVANEIKRHKPLFAVIGAALMIAFSYGMYRFAGKKSPANSPPAINLKRLTATGRVWSGLISSDGKRVVYSVEDTGQQSIWVKQVDTASNVQIVPPSEANYSAFSMTHDGNYLYFIKAAKNGSRLLYQMPAAGGVARMVVEDISSRAALSWDDKRIAFIRGGFLANENALVVANSDGSGEQVIATRKSPENFYPGGIAWTPDGESITCIVGNNARKIIEVPFAGGAERPLKTPKWVALTEVEWISDGSGLIVIAKEQSRSGPSQIWYLSYPSGEARRLTSDFNNYANLSLAANASSLVVTRQETTSHIWVAPYGDPSRAKQLTTGTNRQDGFPSVNWTPDGRIIYDSTATGSRHIWIMNADGSDQRQLTEGGYEDQGSKVSPDGRYIVFTSNRTGIFHIYRINIDGTNVKQLTSGPGEAAPGFSPDGRWVLCSSANYSSWKVPVDGGELVPLTDQGWVSGVSPDGKLVINVRPAGAGGLAWNISIAPFAGGAPLQTFDVTSAYRPNPRWSADGQAIVYNLTHGSDLSGVTNLWIQRLDGGAPKQLTNFASESFFSYDWSRDGKQLVYGRGTTNSDAVLISDFR